MYIETEELPWANHQHGYKPIQEGNEKHNVERHKER